MLTLPHIQSHWGFDCSSPVGWGRSSLIFSYGALVMLELSWEVVGHCFWRCSAMRYRHRSWSCRWPSSHNPPFRSHRGCFSVPKRTDCRSRRCHPHSERGLRPILVSRDWKSQAGTVWGPPPSIHLMTPADLTQSPSHCGSSCSPAGSISGDLGCSNWHRTGRYRLCWRPPVLIMRL